MEFPLIDIPPAFGRLTPGNLLFSTPRANSNRQTYEKLELLVSTFRMRGKRFPNRKRNAFFVQGAFPFPDTAG